jgi:2-polyprenyl-6-methoxyphenol hydroxylase-like FAD-dependent oxidoreductase
MRTRTSITATSVHTVPMNGGRGLIEGTMTRIDPKLAADVLVLGAGPGGASAALHLERAGVKVAVLEARAAEATRANVVDLSSTAVASLRRAGIDSLLDGRMGTSSRTGEAPGAVVALRALENDARSLLAERGVPVAYGARVTGLEQAADGARLIHLADGRTASGRYVINATGGRSGIEQQLGMQLRFQGDYTWFGTARTSVAPELPTGERLGGHLGLERTTISRHGNDYPSFNKLPMPAEQERWRGTTWFGWQNETDGMSAFQTIGSYDFDKLAPAELAERLLAPARAHGATEVLDEPRLVRAESAVVDHARAGAVLAIGDAAGRAHPKHMRGTQLAVTDAERAATTLAGALRHPERADELLDAYDRATLAAHAEYGHDGTRVLAEDPFRHLQSDAIELTALDTWPREAPQVA